MSGGFKSGDPRAKQFGQKGGGKRTGAGKPHRYASPHVLVAEDDAPTSEMIQCQDCFSLFERPRALGRKPTTCPEGCAGDPVSAMRNQIVAEWDLDPAALALLNEACATLDEILDLREQIRKEGVILESGKTNPAQVELRQLRASFRQLVGALNLE